MTAAISQPKPTEAVTTNTNTDTPGGYTRLHIKPFDRDLLHIILPSTVLPAAKDISYHSLQAFPEQRYGFVNLPAADADKIRKKLNGATLRGSKVRIEPARPDDLMARASERLQEEDPAQDRTEDRKRRLKREKKRKRDHNEIPGVELEDGRKVKRGWTVSGDSYVNRRDRKKEKEKNKDKDKGGDEKADKARKKELKKRNREVKSKYSDGPECLVKTRLPPNKATLAGTSASTATATAAAAADDEPDAKKRKKSKRGKEVLVHEFEKTTKFPTFLKQSQSSTTAAAPTEFVEGKGWVDAEGNLVEASRSTRPATSHTPRPPKKVVPELEDDETSSSGSSSSEEEEEDDDEQQSAQSEDSDVAAKEDKKMLLTKDRLDAIADANAGIDATSPQSEFKSDAARPKSSGSTRSLTIKIPPATPAAQKVHPLEALYKRAKSGDDAATTSDAQPFSFFGSEDIEEEDSAPRASQVPMTPFTQQEFEWRNIRSAAPTPDTAHANKTFKFWSGGDGDDDLDEDEEEEDQEDDQEEHQQQLADTTQEGEDDDDNDADKVPTDPSTNFQKWFWEHRGDLNRSWKKRRKMAAKEKRYRENRARASRTI